MRKNEKEAGIHSRQLSWFLSPATWLPEGPSDLKIARTIPQEARAMLGRENCAACLSARSMQWMAADGSDVMGAMGRVWAFPHHHSEKSPTPRETPRNLMARSSADLLPRWNLDDGSAEWVRESFIPFCYFFSFTCPHLPSHIPRVLPLLITYLLLQKRVLAREWECVSSDTLSQRWPSLLRLSLKWFEMEEERVKERLSALHFQQEPPLRVPFKPLFLLAISDCEFWGFFLDSFFVWFCSSSFPFLSRFIIPSFSYIQRPLQGTHSHA